MNQINFQNGRIFIHGVEGLNRSAAVIIAYLMRATPCLLDEAYFYLQVLRPFIRVGLLEGCPIDQSMANIQCAVAIILLMD